MSPAEHAVRYPEVWRRFTPRQTLIRYAWYVAVVFIAAWALRSMDLPWAYFLDAHEQAWDLMVRLVPPDWEVLDEVVDALIETMHIATLGTAVTVIIAFPIAFLAARNTTFNVVTWSIARFILVA